ncbi:MAG: DUF2264 domain-containing protein [Lachnospiraceae bacterium]
MKTRNDYCELLLHYIEPLIPYYPEMTSGLNIGSTAAHYETETIPMEAFSRVLWGLTPLWAGDSDNSLLQIQYIDGIIRGTDPETEDYWRVQRDYDQKFVEMAAFSYSILISPEAIWEKLTEEQQNRLAKWLARINEYRCPDSNWQFFIVLINTALKSVGADYSENHLESAFAKIEECYLLNGWYSDGIHGQCDYYIAFAFHFYSILYYMTMKEKDVARCQKFKERAIEFGKDFLYFFSSNGEAIPYGRSMTYRFAQIAFFSICVAAEIEIVSFGVMKGMIDRHLTYWHQQPILDNGDIMTIGYCYPNLILSEGYNAPGSPYWSLKAFAFLMLPEDHIFYRTESEDLPQLSKRHLSSAPGYLFQQKNDLAVLFPSGMRLDHFQPNYEEKYSKFLYTSKYGFSVSRSQRTLEELAPDNMLAFHVYGHYFVKGKYSRLSITSDHIQYQWSPCKGIMVNTTIRLTEEGHIREHCILNSLSCTVYDCGFAIPIETKRQDYTVFDRNGGGELLDFETTPNTNLIHPKCRILCMKHDLNTGENRIVTEFIY